MTLSEQHKEQIPLSTIILNIRSTKDRLFTAQKASEGNEFVWFNRGVCALAGPGEQIDLGNGRKWNFQKRIIEIKGEARAGQTVAGWFSAEEMVQFMNPDKIHPDLRNIFTNPNRLAQEVGSLSFWLFAIREESIKEYKLPDYMYSRINGIPYMLNWPPEGHSPAELMHDAMKEAGVRLFAITSLNTSQTPEIVDQQEGIKEAQSKGIKIFLEDPYDLGITVGSYTACMVDENGIRLLRCGNIPVEVLEDILNFPIDKDGAKPANWKTKVSSDILKGVDQHEKRLFLLKSISPDRRIHNKKITFRFGK